MSNYWCERAWLGGDGVADGVTIAVDGDRIAAVSRGVGAAPDGAVRLRGITIPGLANAHSHAFHRALRGVAQSGESGTGDFWAWRAQMYALAERLDPDRYFALARATFAEMALAGITLVGEFHYLHHERDGRPYSDPNRMGDVIIAAAREAGIRLTLLDACYLHGDVASAGTGAELVGVQRRFGDGDADRWAARVDALASGSGAGSDPGSDPMVRIGAAIHSVRAVDPAAAATVAGWANTRAAPLHAHVSEQPAENSACRAAYGRTPTELLADAGAVHARFTAVHATHVTGHDVSLLGGARATCCLCPTTERDLADGVGPAARLRDAGSPLALGTDSHAVIDLFEDARGVELNERLVTGVRGTHRAPELLSAATAAGYASLGWTEGGSIAVGGPADFVTVGLDSVRLAGTVPEHALDALVFAAGAADVQHVVVGGRVIVQDALHRTLDVGRELRDAIAAVRAVSTLVVDRIGLLVTNDGELGTGPLGVRRDAAVMIEDERVVAVGAAGSFDADARVDADGRCVIPGFVDSHTHLVFAGDRADEFAQRMAGRAYEAGGIRVTTEATRAASVETLTELTAARRHEARRAGITHVEIKSGYGLDTASEQRCCEVARAFTDDVTFLGAHVVPEEFAARPDEYVALVCTDMVAACAPFCRWVDVFCEEGAFDRDQSRAVLEAGRAAGLGLRVHANQLGPGPGVQLAVDMEAASADHCTHLTAADVDALAASDTVATLLPATDFSTRQPYPDARRLIDAGARVAIATNCNPGSSYTTSMSFCLALAVRDMHMTAEEALQAATVGGAAALRRPDLGRITPGARADAVVLAAPSYTHLVYRPGVPLVHAVVERGALA